MLAHKHVLTVKQSHLTVFVEVVCAALAVVLISSDIDSDKDNRDNNACDSADPAELFERLKDFRLVALFGWSLNDVVICSVTRNACGYVLLNLGNVKLCRPVVIA